MTTPTSSDLVDRVHRALWNDPEPPPAGGTDETTARIMRLLSTTAPMATPSEIDYVVDEVRARIDGLGPLHEYATDELVTEIMVIGDGSIWVERAGVLMHTGQSITADSSLNLVRRLAASVGRRIDQTQPSVDLRLADGSRLHAIIPPLAIDGPCITVRRFAVRPIRLDELAAPRAGALLSDAVRNGETIVVAGGTSSGKTTLLNALGAFIPADSRIVTIEDAAELRLPGRHVVRLETRRATEGTAEVGLRELTRNALRMRPDRIVCGEMRGAEALDLVQAMNTGHRGSLSTVHANGMADALRRIETMMLLADSGLPLPAVRDQLASCIDLVVMTRRLENGQRRVSEIGRVPAHAPDHWELDALYVEEVEAT